MHSASLAAARACCPESVRPQGRRRRGPFRVPLLFPRSLPLLSSVLGSRRLKLHGRRGCSLARIRRPHGRICGCGSRVRLGGSRRRRIGRRRQGPLGRWVSRSGAAKVGRQRPSHTGSRPHCTGSVSPGSNPAAPAPDSAPPTGVHAGGARWRGGWCWRAALLRPRPAARAPPPETAVGAAVGWFPRLPPDEQQRLCRSSPAASTLLRLRCS